MSKPLRFGLIAEGDSRFSHILRLPNIAEDLGPVKSSSLAIASKLSNFIRAGYAVSEYDDLQAARVVLVRVPDATLPRIIDDLYAAGLVLSNYSFVLCESWLTTEALRPLRQRGAAVATVVNVPSDQRKWFLMEGDQLAVRQLRQFIDKTGARALEIRTGTKHLYFAAELLATALAMPTLIASQQALRGTGLATHNLKTISEEMIQEMFRGFLRGAKMIWGGPLNECSPELASAHLNAVRGSNPEIAEVIDAYLPYAREFMSRYRASTEDAG
jgi:predicted short-subunit dehydrogenase-like oxidoreductase (DUF2520 family)